MITYSYTNDSGISHDQKIAAQQNFEKKMEHFIQEIDDKNGFVDINFAITNTNDNRYYNLTFPNHDLFEFTARVQAYSKAQQQ